MNEAFKSYAKANNVKLYQIAERLGIDPSRFSVQYMRHELTPAETANLKKLVREIKNERGTK